MNMKKQSKKMVGKCLSIFTALLLVLSFMPGTAAVYAQSSGTTQLAVAQYTSASGEVAAGSTATNATYNGKWEAHVPMGKVMSAMESQMSTLAQGFFGHYPYPHGKDGANKIAYIEYSVTFPEGVTVDASNIQMKNSTAMFNGNEFSSSVSGQKVTFKFPLQDRNWKGIYELYQKDGGAQSEKTIDFSIHYTVNATSKEEAAKAENMNITAQGDFSTCPSGSSWPSGMNVTKTDKSVHSLAPDFSKAACFANAPGGNSNTGNQDPNTGNQDPTNPSTPPTVKTNNVLDADLLLGEDTGKTVIEKDSTAQMAFTGTLNVKPIKDQMETIEKTYLKNEPAQNAPLNPSNRIMALYSNNKVNQLDQIALSNLSSTFTAKLIIPEGLRFTNQTSASFEGGKNKDGKEIFTVTNTEVKDNIATVEFTLQDTDKIKSYADLKKAITSVDDTLKITFQAVEFDSSSKANTEYTVTGTVSGGMKATATYNQKAINFDLKWDGKQSAAGAYNNEKNQIKLVVKRTGPDITDMGGTGKLEGDLLINGDTQHDNVYLTGMDTPFTMTGLLNVKPIKDELSRLKTAHSQSVETNDIDVSNMKTSFTATMTLPDELKFPADADKKVTLDGANGKFKIQSAVVSGQTITVTMVPTLDLTKSIRPFEEISYTVEGVEDELKVNVPGVTVDSTKAKTNTQYTINGDVKGDFSALATKKSSGKIRRFTYTWNGIQQKGGEDSTDLNTKDIKLTLKTAEFSQSVALCGDILVNGNTEHDAVYVAGQDATVPFTGKLDVTPVKNQLKTIEKIYNSKGIDPKDITLSDYSSLFTATLTLPNEMDFVASPKVTLKNDNGKYKITDWKINGKTITVNMTVNATVSTFKDLKDAVEQMDDALEVEVNGAKFNASALANTNYTVYGTMNGELKAKATHKTSGTSLTFAFTWNAKQCKDGADYLYRNSDNISFSLKWEKSSPWTPPTPPTPPTPNPHTPDPSTPNPPAPVVPNKPEPVEPTPTTPATKKPATPNTADASDTTLYLVTVLISLAGVTVLEARRREER